MSARKVCKRCNTDKPLSEFPPDRSGKHGVRTECRPCYREYMRGIVRKSRAKDPERARQWRRNAKTSPAGKAAQERENARKRRLRAEAREVKEVLKRDVTERREAMREARNSLTGVALRYLRDATRSGECLVTHLKPRKDGYAKTSLGGRYYAIHRLVYEGWYGDISPRTPVHHTCANRLCIEPSHLQAVTPQQNTAEMLERRAYLARIEALENALRELSPYHPELPPL